MPERDDIQIKLEIKRIMDSVETIMQRVERVIPRDGETSAKDNGES
jgi:hypothetical protein